jgi:phosphoribosylamine--glycine ligase
VDGLAAGKGAIVCDTPEEAENALIRIFDNYEFGEAGKRVIIEEKLIGEEASVFTLTDGLDYKILPVSQDHKAIFDGDRGPNTGGMGAYTPIPLIDKPLLEQIEREIIKRTIDAMAEEGMPYNGLLYAGLMITKDGPKVIEYNCRFGDPETQAVLPLIECDWFNALAACTDGSLESVEWRIKPGSCVTVVLASEGYPGKYKKGVTINGIEDAERNKTNVDVYHAGTKRDKHGNFLTNGGRVLNVSAWSDSLEEAISTAYESAASIDFKGKYFRRDIGLKGIARLSK